jgi:hypothetical protein
LHALANLGLALVDLGQPALILVEAGVDVGAAASFIVQPLAKLGDAGGNLLTCCGGGVEAVSQNGRGQIVDLSCAALGFQVAVELAVGGLL